MSDDGFAIAEAFQDGRYANLQMKQEIYGDAPMYGLIVKPEIARKQIDEERSKIPAENARDDENSNENDNKNDDKTPPTVITPPKKKNRHFSMDVPLDSVRINKDVSTYTDEILSHLINLSGARAEIRLDVDVEVPNGAPSNVVTTVSENCRTLKIDNFHFEE